MPGLIKVSFTAPNQPIAGDGSATPVTWTTLVDSDTDPGMSGWWDSSDPTYLKIPTDVAPTNGILSWRLAMSVANPNPGGSRRWAGVYRNDITRDITAHHHFRTTTKGAEMLDGQALLKFYPGDRFQLLALQDSTVPLAIIGDAALPAVPEGENTQMAILLVTS